jgi:hypothetical protein
VKRKAFHILIGLIIAAMFWFTTLPLTFAQSQALNGQIEGAIADYDKAVVARVIVSVTNIETGATRTVTTDESGVYRFPLLPLGTYRITVETPNFKKLVREGVILAIGQTATINFSLEAGDISEVVTVAADSFVADAGKTDLGRVINAREARNLPLVALNPYNFVFLQTNVTGRPRGGFFFPNLNANGYLRRVNYQLDGNTNTSYHNRTRFMQMSDVYVAEIQLVTSGFASEFGDTPGMIMNIVTPSGTNAVHGSLSYRFRRPSFYSRPFFYSSDDDVPDTNADNFTFSVGGPIIKDRWHLFFGYQWQHRDDRASAARLLTVTPANRATLINAGHSPSIFPLAIPALEKGSFYILRTDLQINPSNRLAVRLNYSDLDSPNGIGGRLNTLERSVDAFSTDHAVAVQLASYTPKTFNEVRFQYGELTAGYKRNEFSGTGPSIVINRVANLGSPLLADTIFPPVRVTQLQNNLTRTTGSHVAKFGGGLSFHDYSERSLIFSQYTFPDLASYLAARNGTPRSYGQYTETVGDPGITYNSAYWNIFAQDDWKVTRRLKINFGLRYDFYRIAKADPTSLFSLSQRFDVDRNDFAPRLGVVYALREGNRPTVLRLGGGIYYEAPLMAIYRDVLRFNGSPSFSSFTFDPESPDSPAFPNVLPPGSLAPPQDIFTIARDYDTMYAMHANVQLEQAITEDMSLAVGYVHSSGRHLNVYRNINPINPIGALADGRPVFGKDRLDPRFGWIVIAESSGVARYDGLALQLKQRLSRGLQFSVSYTLSKGINDAPDGDTEGLYLSDPTNRNFDKGYSTADQLHTLVASIVFQPSFGLENKTLRSLFDHNQFGIIATATSGDRFNIIANAGDLNGDDILGDRPAGIKRNSGKTPPLYNVDLRYSRLLNFTERYRLELFGEFQNLFNTNGIVGFSDTRVSVNPQTGELIGPLPDFRVRNSSTAQESRQFQVGMKFMF